ncbi:hypothetical protein [Rhizobium mongolense]|uniref:Uncharacterized protein n=1 Tax=Rhizobium mongolense TaxID=57676 RepID=A0A7W6WGI6_9HYPH|nr:hypothetical protein [Rhizobium mongolense]MBB4277025.1 hypothetical protein [Rhizobium mongolense]
MVIYSLAARLNKTRQEIEAMPVDEFYEWIAFFELSKEQGQ